MDSWRGGWTRVNQNEQLCTRCCYKTDKWLIWVSQHLIYKHMLRGHTMCMLVFSDKCDTRNAHAQSTATVPPKLLPTGCTAGVHKDTEKISVFLTQLNGTHDWDDTQPELVSDGVMLPRDWFSQSPFHNAKSPLLLIHKPLLFMWCHRDSAPALSIRGGLGFC